MNPEEDLMKVFLACLVSSIFIALCGAIISLLTSCTYTINLVHTDGQASDVVDETCTPTADIKPVIQVPLTP